MTKLTNQEIFDKALFGIRGQDYKQSNTLYGGGGSCKYRGPDGRMCAVGHCIPDDLAYKWDSNKWDSSIGFLYTDNPAGYDSVFYPESLGLLTSLQEAHDVDLSFSSAQWETKMQEIAEKYNLTYTPV